MLRSIRAAFGVAALALGAGSADVAYAQASEDWRFLPIAGGGAAFSCGTLGDGAEVCASLYCEVDGALRFGVDGLFAFDRAEEYTVWTDASGAQGTTAATVAERDPDAALGAPDATLELPDIENFADSLRRGTSLFVAADATLSPLTFSLAGSGDAIDELRARCAALASPPEDDGVFESADPFEDAAQNGSEDGLQVQPEDDPALADPADVALPSESDLAGGDSDPIAGLGANAGEGPPVGPDGFENGEDAQGAPGVVDVACVRVPDSVGVFPAVVLADGEIALVSNRFFDGFSEEECVEALAGVETFPGFVCAPADTGVRLHQISSRDPLPHAETFPTLAECLRSLSGVQNDLLCVYNRAGRVSAYSVTDLEPAGRRSFPDLDSCLAGIASGGEQGSDEPIEESADAPLDETVAEVEDDGFSCGLLSVGGLPRAFAIVERAGEPPYFASERECLEALATESNGLVCVLRQNGRFAIYNLRRSGAIGHFRDLEECSSALQGYQPEQSLLCIRRFDGIFATIGRDGRRERISQYRVLDDCIEATAFATSTEICIWGAIGGGRYYAAQIDDPTVFERVAFDSLEMCAAMIASRE